MVGWNHQLNGPEFEQAPGVGDGQGSLACRSPWGHKEMESDDYPLGYGVGFMGRASEVERKGGVSMDAILQSRFQKSKQ